MPLRPSAPGDEIQHVDWARILPDDMKGRHKTKSHLEKIHVVVSLILFLQLPFAPLILFLFRSEDAEVKQRAGNFVRHQGNAKEESDSFFPPATLFRLWYERFDVCRDNLHRYLVAPCAFDLVAAESDKGIRSADLRVRISSLTMTGIREALHPGKLLRKYQDLFPFTFDLLLAFTTRPNRYRKYNLTPEDVAAEAKLDADSLDDDGLEEDESLDPKDKDPKNRRALD
ncbi:hypothetical protein SCHPADRAFT_897244 [Schizopora paradoxa]|uniref:Uncharacterized protein n=1 Tax=Schizopora paradoxa TaxID=27342 RepID=A0A0H2QX42_9AGAM|nr:hypothetical protein SCHPADRAFT_897244 [Schizopora paradoxa]